MKKNYFKSITSVGLLCLTIAVHAQKDNVGIGTSKPDQSAILDLSSQTKGFLTPRMTLEQRSKIQNPANGLMIYQTDLLSGFYFFDGKEWKPMSSETKANSVADANNWGIIGNSGMVLGTNFIGNIDNNSLEFRVNNQRAGLLSNATNQYMGYLAGASASTAPSTVNNTAFGNAAFQNGSGEGNAAIGTNTLKVNSGTGNTALGNGALANNTTGGFNMGIGSNSLLFNVTGSGNVGVGTSALRNTLGSNNVAIGFLAGYLKNGTGNIYIGYSAGQGDGPDPITTAESNQLYIANSNTKTPLIRGDFSNNNLKFHLGAAAPTNTTGFLAIGDFTGATPPILNFNAGGTTQNTYRLIVQDGIMTEKLKVAIKGTADWADYVFDPSYKLMPLDKVESFVKENKHLPNVPSADEMAKSGLDVMQTSAKLMEKIEELTLYMIEMNKEIKALKAENAKFKK